MSDDPTRVMPRGEPPRRGRRDDEPHYTPEEKQKHLRNLIIVLVAVIIGLIIGWIAIIALTFHWALPWVTKASSMTWARPSGRLPSVRMVSTTDVGSEFRYDVGLFHTFLATRAPSGRMRLCWRNTVNWVNTAWFR